MGIVNTDSHRHTASSQLFNHSVEFAERADFCVGRGNNQKSTGIEDD
jgi:hypothetical protein